MTQSNDHESDAQSQDIRPPLERSFSRYVKQPFNEFVDNQTTGAIILLASTFIALFLANSDYASFYHQFEKVTLGLFVDDFRLEMDLHEWVNDGLMVLFFFILGLEVKREFIAGELSSIKNSAAVILAAVGGMMFPALIYYAINYGGEGSSGWGVPMATDTAFALGIMALLGSKVNPSLKVFLVALAIVDDIGAVIVIALFYTDQIVWNALYIAAGFFVGLLALNRFGIRGPFWYVVLALGLWYFILQSGVHATIAGVLAALAIPARPKMHPGHLAHSMKNTAGAIYQRLSDPQQSTDEEHREVLSDESKDSALGEIQRKASLTRTPLRIWENLLDKPVSLLIVPIFAFLNAGTEVTQQALNNMLHAPIAWGIVFGLLVGKPLGIFSLTWLSVKTGVGEINSSLNFKEIFGLSVLAGMGFTMSMFIALLSFDDSQQQLLDAKLGIMLATLIAGILGYLWLRFVTPYQGESS